MKQLISLAALVALTAGCSTIKITPESVKFGAAALTRAASGHPEYTYYLTAAKDAICLVAGSTNVTPATISAAIPNGTNPTAVAITDGILALLFMAYNSFDIPPAGGAFGPYAVAACDGMAMWLPTPPEKTSAFDSKWPLKTIP